MGARSVMGLFGGGGGGGGCKNMKKDARAHPNDPIIERAPSLSPGFHSFCKWAVIEKPIKRTTGVCPSI